MSPDNFKAVMFDLDGTLLDTLRDLADSMNFVLEQRNMPTHPVDAYRFFVGNGMDMLVRRTLPPDIITDEIVADCLKQYRKTYSKNWAKNTKPYPGIHELLIQLPKRDIIMTVLSNKPHELTELTVKHFFPGYSFDIVRGVKPEVPKKPDPTAAMQIAQQLELKPSQILYIGDTNTDMKTAVAAGMYPAGALWGFREADELLQNGAKTLLSHPLEALDLFELTS